MTMGVDIYPDTEKCVINVNEMTMHIPSTNKLYNRPKVRDTILGTRYVPITRDYFYRLLQECIPLHVRPGALHRHDISTEMNIFLASPSRGPHEIKMYLVKPVIPARIQPS